MIPVVMLNLPQHTERRRRMESQLAALDIRFTLADMVDGKTVSTQDASADRARFLRCHGREMTAGELGCARTHLTLAQRIASGPNDFVCVIEDDLDLSPDILPFLDEKIIGGIRQFDVLRLFSPAHREHKAAWKVSTIFDRSIVAPLRVGWGTQAQIYSRDGAAKVAKLKVTGPIDSMIYYNPTRALRVLEVRPSLITELRDFGSSTRGWENIPQSGRTYWNERMQPLLARMRFVRAWGADGIRGLIRSRYRPSLSGADHSDATDGRRRHDVDRRGSAT